METTIFFQMEIRLVQIRTEFLKQESPLALRIAAKIKKYQKVGKNKIKMPLPERYT